jgi:hypothetical protein
MYDLAISEHGDLIVAGNRDLAGVSGIDLIDQRIVIRLKIHRGTWIFDAEGTLGSFLYRVLGQAPQSALEIDSYVREALRQMTEISIEEVVTEYDEDLKSLTVQVLYSQNPEVGESDIDLPSAIQSTTVTIPYVMGEV